MLTPFDRLLRNAVDHLGLWQPCRFQHGRGDVDHMVVLVAYFALRLDPLRPEDDRTVGGAAVLRMEL